MATIRQNHSVDVSHNSSCLDHLLLPRGNATAACVFGDAHNGVQYGLLAADYVLCKLLSNPRYRRVICICFDRRSDSLISIAEAYLQVKWKLISWSRGAAGRISIIRHAAKSPVNLSWRSRKWLYKSCREHLYHRQHTVQPMLMIFILDRNKIAYINFR